MNIRSHHGKTVPAAALAAAAMALCAACRAETNDLSDHQARLSLARVLSWQDGKLAEAQAEYEKLAAARPDDMTVRLELAMVQARMKRYEKAALNLDAVLARCPDNADALLWRARLNMWTGRPALAVPLLEKLRAMSGSPPEAALELARANAWVGNRSEARKILESLAAVRTNDANVLAELADLEAFEGHAAKCRALYRRAIALSEDPARLALREADQMSRWGDFLAAETRYREDLAAHPGSTDTALRLAAVLRSSQHYEEAEGVYAEILLRSPKSAQALFGMAELRHAQKRFAEAAALAQSAIEAGDESADALALQAESLLQAGMLAEAEAAWRRLQSKGGRATQAALGIGRTRRAGGDEKAASNEFLNAWIADRDNPQAQAFHMGDAWLDAKDFRQRVRAAEAGKPGSAADWAWQAAAMGRFDLAADCWRIRVETDPDCLPARIELAEATAIDHEYARAIELYSLLREEEPANWRVLIGLARVLGWAGRYDDALAVYQEVLKLRPGDPVSLRESARTAFWAKRADQGLRFYGAMQEPPVDRLLLAQLDAIRGAEAFEPLADLAAALRSESGASRPHQRFEAFRQGWDNVREHAPAELRAAIDSALVRLLPACLIQRAAFLESEAKRLAWNRHFRDAAGACSQLLAIEPDNQEAAFDRGQALCAAGLYREARESYERLLAGNSFHNLARMALERERLRSRPSAGAGYSYWNERGYGDIARIRRHSVRAAALARADDAAWIKASALAWDERPHRVAATYRAYGPSIEAGGRLGRRADIAAGWTRKSYSDGDISDTDTGYGSAAVEPTDGLRIEIGASREDALHNEFCIIQKVQMDSAWLAPRLTLGHSAALFGRASFHEYNDDNGGQRHGLGAELALSDHPRVLKAIVEGEYRDTRHASRSVYADGALIDIVHPYWSPQDYWAGRLTLEWRHDLSAFFFHGAPIHYYDLKAAVGTDSNDNPSFECNAEWRCQFLGRWTAFASGMVHRSEEWDAEAVAAGLDCRF